MSSTNPTVFDLLGPSATISGGVVSFQLSEVASYLTGYSSINDIPVERFFGAIFERMRQAQTSSFNAKLIISKPNPVIREGPGGAKTLTYVFDVRFNFDVTSPPISRL